MKPLFDIDDIMPGSLDGQSFCSPTTYKKIHKNWPAEYGKLTPISWCPNYQKKPGRGQRKLYALVFVCLEGRVDTYLISGVYERVNSTLVWEKPVMRAKMNSTKSKSGTSKKRLKGKTRK